MKIAASVIVTTLLVVVALGAWLNGGEREAVEPADLVLPVGVPVVAPVEPVVVVPSVPVVIEREANPWPEAYDLLPAPAPEAPVVERAAPLSRIEGTEAPWWETMEVDEWAK